MNTTYFEDAYSVSPKNMSDEQIALRDAMTVTAVSQAESVAAIAASLHSLLDGLCKSVERLERERSDLIDYCNGLLGLFQLIENRCDPELLEIVRTNHRVVDAKEFLDQIGAEKLLAGG